MLGETLWQTKWLLVASKTRRGKLKNKSPWRIERAWGSYREDEFLESISSLGEDKTPRRRFSTTLFSKMLGFSKKTIWGLLINTKRVSNWIGASTTHLHHFRRLMEFKRLGIIDLLVSCGSIYKIITEVLSCRLKKFWESYLNIKLPSWRVDYISIVSCLGMRVI